MSALSQNTPEKRYNRMWLACPTWQLMSDALAHFSLHVVMKVKRADPGRKHLSERKPGQWLFVFEVHCHSSEELDQVLCGEGGARGCGLCCTRSDTDAVSVWSVNLCGSGKFPFIALHAQLANFIFLHLFNTHIVIHISILSVSIKRLFFLLSALFSVFWVSSSDPVR